MPPVAHAFDDQLARAAADLTARYVVAAADGDKDHAKRARRDWSVDRGGEAAAWAAMSTDQRVYVLEQLLEAAPLPHDLLAALDRTYHLSEVRNAEVRFKWQRLCLRAAYEPIYPHVERFVHEIGRMKFLLPLMTALADVNRPLALRIFEERKLTAHPIAVAALKRKLKL